MKRNDALRSATGARPHELTTAVLAIIEGGAGQQAPAEGEEQGPGLDKKAAGPTGVLYQKWTDTFGTAHPNAIHKPTIFERLAPKPAPESETQSSSTQQQ
jgi:hypothetical protein